MSPADTHILILDDGELEEIRSAAGSLGALVHTELEGPEAPVSWPLVVTSPRYLDALDALPVNLDAKRVVVLDQLSHTLRARMKRSRVDFVLRRPAHPEALRLLLLHCLYRGPERRQRRVTVGAAIRFRAGFRRGEGVLADLSDAGCRILSDDPLAIGARPLVFLPRPEKPTRSFYVRAEVVRVQRGIQRQPEMALRFQGLGRSAIRRIGGLIALYDEGPAVFHGRASPPAVAAPALDPPAAAPEIEADALTPAAAARESCDAAASMELLSETFGAEEEATPRRESLDFEEIRSDEVPEAFAAPPPVFSGGEEASMDAAVEAALSPRSEAEAASEGKRPVASVASDDEASDTAKAVMDERRREPRHEFNRQVVALDRSAPRVLVGRDLSVGGMRVDRNDALTPRKSFRLSIHVREGEVPLVLRARVARDDGDNGFLLRFDPLSFAVQEQLRKSLRELPILMAGEGGEPEAVLITEMIDEDASGEAALG